MTLLPSANEVCEGYVFTRVCHSVPRGGGSPGPYPGGRLAGWSVSRPRWGGGVSQHQGSHFYGLIKFHDISMIFPGF